MKIKLLCVLHRSPPTHGAAKVGDFISESKKLQEKYDCKFITIKSSDTIGDIGKINLKKFYLVFELYMKVLWMLLWFRPDKLYYTASIKGVALYRDILVSTLWKLYGTIFSLDVYYHYHTKGIADFVSKSSRNLKLTNFFMKNVNIILLSPLLQKDIDKVHSYKQILFLPNGVENNYTTDEFEKYITKKDFNNKNILYLSNMIKSKGYFEVLKLANLNKENNYHFHFAGGWQNKADKAEFFEYIKKNSLEKSVSFHGFISGKQKIELFEKASLFIFPTKYANEAFPLSILEALSHGLPIISTDEGSIPYILDKKSGTVINALDNLSSAFDSTVTKLLNIDTSRYCRKRYEENFSLEQFEENLVKIFR